MQSIIDYVENELRDFGQAPFSPVDSLVLSQLAYLRLGALVPAPGCPDALPLRELLRAELFGALLDEVRAPEQNRRLLFAAAASPRFRGVLLSRFADDQDPLLGKSFSAVTFSLGPALHYLAFRGTDATLVGWKEDFNMAFQTVPSQQAALDYARAAADALPGALLLGGHSKGGNLAVYSAMMCPPAVRARLQAVYSHDGPGFMEGTLSQECFRRVEPLIHKTLPQSSIIGMLLEHQENYSVVKSSRVGIMQHDPFSWEVQDGRFVPLEQLTAGARYMDGTLNQWIGAMTAPEREGFTDTLFGVLTAGGITSFQGEHDWQQLIPAMAEAVRSLDPADRTMTLRLLRALGVLAVRNLAAGRQTAPAQPGAV